jgi:hypothetical protein
MRLNAARNMYGLLGAERLVERRIGLDSVQNGYFVGLVLDVRSIGSLMPLRACERGRTPTPWSAPAAARADSFESRHTARRAETRAVSSATGVRSRMHDWSILSTSTNGRLSRDSP